MPSNNNLRIIHQNLVDLSTTSITTSATTTGFSKDNLKSDIKSLTWRSTGNIASIVVDLGSQQVFQTGGIILGFTNLNSSATMRVVGSNNLNQIGISGTSLNITTPTPSLVFDTTQQCCPWALSLPDWGTNPVGSSNYSYGGGTYARAWISSPNPVRYLGIQITNNTGSPPLSYIDISRLIIGNYWSPLYNTGYGMSAGIKDLSEHMRTEGGDLLTKRGPRVRTLNFDLQWLANSDRKEITKIFLGNGMPRPLFVSLFPDSTGGDDDYQREGIHQIYGKMVQVPGVSYNYFEIYATNMELEEV